MCKVQSSDVKFKLEVLADGANTGKQHVWRDLDVYYATHELHKLRHEIGRPVHSNLDRGKAYVRELSGNGTPSAGRTSEARSTSSR